MRKRCTGESLDTFREHLKGRDMKPNTIEKYIRDVRKFLAYLGGGVLDHAAVAGYRDYLLSRYKDTSANSMLAALNGYLKYIGRKECCIRLLRIQRQLFLDETKELTRYEYELLVAQAEREGNRRLSCILQTLGSTGIRVSELTFITVEALGQKSACIHSKGKIRHILLPDTLVDMLTEYCRQAGRRSGCIFVTRTGRPMDRRNIWSSMKALCHRAGVNPSKVYPHNLRHLFARCFYEKEKDIVRLADYLGHSSVETTRRYTMTSNMEACRQSLEMGFLLFGNADSLGNASGPDHKKAGSTSHPTSRKRKNKKARRAGRASARRNKKARAVG